MLYFGTIIGFIWFHILLIMNVKTIRTNLSSIKHIPLCQTLWGDLIAISKIWIIFNFYFSLNISYPMMSAILVYLLMLYIGAVRLYVRSFANVYIYVPLILLKWVILKVRNQSINKINTWHNSCCAPFHKQLNYCSNP